MRFYLLTFKKLIILFHLWKSPIFPLNRKTTSKSVGQSHLFLEKPHTQPTWLMVCWRDISLSALVTRRSGDDIFNPNSQKKLANTALNKWKSQGIRVAENEIRFLREYFFFIMLFAKNKSPGPNFKYKVFFDKIADQIETHHWKTFKKLKLRYSRSRK